MSDCLPGGKRSPGESMRPGFPFGPTRSNTCAGLPLTERILVPAVRRSLAVRGSGAAAAPVTGRKGITPAMAAPDARMRRRVRSVGFSFSLNGVFQYVLFQIASTIGHAWFTYIMGQSAEPFDLPCRALLGIAAIGMRLF
jgi:hypothetical protein